MKAASIYVWTRGGEKLTLSQAADDCDSTYHNLHIRYKEAVKNNRRSFETNKTWYSLDRVDPVEPEPKATARIGKPLMLAPGYCRHRLG